MNIKLKLLILVFIVLSLFIYLYFYETRQIKEHFSSLDQMKYNIMMHIDGMGKDPVNSNFLKYNNVHLKDFPLRNVHNNFEGLFYYNQTVRFNSGGFGSSIQTFSYSDDTKRYLQNEFGDSNHPEDLFVNWHTSNVTTMKNMFKDCKAFILDITSINTNNLSDSTNMFEGATAFLNKFTRSKGPCAAIPEFDGPPSCWSHNIFKPVDHLVLKNAVQNMGKNPNRADFLKYDPDNQNPASETNPHSNGFHIKDWDVSEITDMSHIFRGWGNNYTVETLQFLHDNFGNPDYGDIGLNNWNVSNVTNMKGMFLQCFNFNQDISSWKVFNVINMEQMFSECHNFNQDISGWNVEKVTNMRNMFFDAVDFSQDLSSWNPIKLQKMDHMFLGPVYFGDVSGWTTDYSSTISDLTKMFYASDSDYGGPVPNFVKDFKRDPNCTISGNEFDGPPECWIKRFKPTTKNDLQTAINFMGQDHTSESFLRYDSSKPKYLHSAANEGEDHSQGAHISNWDVSEVTDMTNLFSMHNDKYSEDTKYYLQYEFGDSNHPDNILNGWDTRNVENMESMFENCRKFNHDISGWDTRNVGNMKSMFENCRKFNHDISGWDVSLVENMNGMFNSATDFSQNITEWNTPSLTSSSNMFGTDDFANPPDPPIAFVTDFTRDPNCPGYEFDGPPNCWTEQKNTTLKKYKNRYAFAALKSDNTVVTWGHGDYGGNSNSVSSQLNNVIEIFSTQTAFAALKSDNTVVTWGHGGNGGNSDNVRDQLTNIKCIYSNSTAFAALKYDNTVVTWGNQANGGNSNNVRDQLTGIRTIYSTWDAFAALKSNNTVVTWGNQANGGNSKGVTSQLNDIINIFATLTAFAALKSDNKVVTWGNQEYGGNSNNVRDQLTGIKTIYSTDSAFAALKYDGNVVTWGNPNDGGSKEIIKYKGVSTSLSQYSLTNIIKIYSNKHAFVALKSTGNIVTWGSDEYGGRGIRYGPNLMSENIIDIFSTDEAFAALLKPDRHVVSWGWNDKGLDTDETTEYGGDSGGYMDVDIYDNIEDLQNVKTIYSTSTAFAAVKDDGQVITWGRFWYGGIQHISSGDADTASSQLSEDNRLENVFDIFSTARAFAALKKDGSNTRLVTWGWESYGGDYNFIKYNNANKTSTNINNPIDIINIFPNNKVTRCSKFIRSSAETGANSNNENGNNIVISLAETGANSNNENGNNIVISLANSGNSSPFDIHRAVIYMGKDPEREADFLRYDPNNSEPASGSNPHENGVHISNWDVSKVTDMSNLFNSEHYLYDFPLDTSYFYNELPYFAFEFGDQNHPDDLLSKWDTSNVTTMKNMFKECQAFILDITSINTNNLSDSTNMFEGATEFLNNFKRDPNCTISGNEFDGPPSCWSSNSLNTSADPVTLPIPVAPLDDITIIQAMTNMELDDTNGNFLCFNGIHISNWNTNNVTDMTELFSSLNTSYSNDLQAFLQSQIFNSIDLSTKLAKFSNEIFTNYTYLAWDTKKVESMEKCFFSSNFNGNISNWNTNNLKNLHFAFAVCPFNQDISTKGIQNKSWDVRQVENMIQVFMLNTEFNQNISNWDVSNVKNFNSMFEDASSFDYDIKDWYIISRKLSISDNISPFANMFSGATAFLDKFTRDPSCPGEKYDGPPSCWKLILSNITSRVTEINPCEDLQFLREDGIIQNSLDKIELCKDYCKDKDCDHYKIISSIDIF
jgi:surface protein